MALPADGRTDARDATRRGLWAPFASLLTGQGVATVLGLVFWVVAARVAEPAALGVATAAISTQTLLGLFVSLGLGTHLVTELPGAGRQVVRRWVHRALLGAGAVGVVVAGVLVAVIEGVRALGPDFGGALGEGLAEPLVVVGFVLGVVAATGVLVLDEAVLGLRRSRVQLTRNVTASLLRFPVGAVLLLLVGADAWVVQATWVLPLLVSLLLALRSLRLPGSPPAPWSADVRDHLRPALRHHAINVAVSSGSMIVPVVAGLSLAATDNAAFAVAWLLATAAFVPPYLLAAALYAHAAHEGPVATGGSDPAVVAHLRRTVPTAFAFVLVAWVFAVLLSEPALRLLEGPYAVESSHLLVLLVPAGFCAVVKDHLVVVWRRQKRYRLAAGVAVVTVVAETLGAVTGAVADGATGLVLGWLTVSTIELALGAPVLLRHMNLLNRRRAEVPARPPRRRDERGRAAWSLVALLTVSGLLAVGLIAGLAATGDDGERGNAQEELERTPTAECVPSPENPGPDLDLTIKVDTGDPDNPFRSEAEVEQLLDAAVDAGASVISTGFSWRVAQSKADGEYDYTGLDRVVDAARERGLEVKVQLLHMAFWAFDPGAVKYGPWAPPRSDTELARWATFVEDTTTHLAGRARYVEIWSNPDSAKYWRTGPDPAEFARMMWVSSAAVKRADPGVQVVSGGVNANLPYLTGMMEQFKDRQPPFDLLGLHVYGDADSMLDPQALYGRTVQRLTRLGFDLPLYITEMGWPTNSVPDDLRAERTAVALDAITCDEQIQVVSWYALHESLWDAPMWALLDPSWEPSLTYEALREWSDRRTAAVEEAG